MELLIPGPTSRICLDCGVNVPQGASFCRSRCERCYERHIYALKKEGAFTPLDMSRPLLARFLEKTAPADNGCTLWTGALSHKTGYGWISAGKKTKRRLAAHRAAHELFIGPIPPGMHVDHLCHNADASCPGGITCLHRRCVNPDHLEAVPQAENIRRAPRGTARRTHCPQGHPYDETNTIRDAHGWRHCRICVNARRRADYRKEAP